MRDPRTGYFGIDTVLNTSWIPKKQPVDSDVVHTTWEMPSEETQIEMEVPQPTGDSTSAEIGKWQAVKNATAAFVNLSLWNTRAKKKAWLGTIYIIVISIIWWCEELDPG